MKTYFHGEVIIREIKELPYGVKKVEARKDGGYLLADSETSGNYHLLEEKKGVEVYEKAGVLYCKNSVPIDVYCAHKNRHDNQTLEPKIWEIYRAQEHDYLTGMNRSVAD